MAAGGFHLLRWKTFKQNFLPYGTYLGYSRTFHALKKSLSSKCSWFRPRDGFSTTVYNMFSFRRNTTLSTTGLCNLACVQFLSPSNAEKHSSSRRRYSTHSQRHSPTSLYDVLGVTPKATQSQIKSAYFRLSKSYHPDVNKSSTAASKFTQIAEAYSVLGNVRSRRLYDRGIYHPHRPHVSHAAEDYDDDETSFSHQEGFRPAGRRPPTGRSPVYNFDEFYRAHYGEAQKRYEKERQYHYEQLQQLEEDRRKKIAHTYVMILLMMILALTAATQLFDEPRPVRPAVERRKEKHIDESLD